MVAEVDELEPNQGLDTVPFYEEGSYEFNTKKALMLVKQDENRERLLREGFEVEVKKRFEGAEEVARDEGLEAEEEDKAVFDPWLSPPTRKASDLPPALRGFPKDDFGYPDWTRAVERGYIKPRGAIIGEEKAEKEFTDDIVFVINDMLMANVVFPHKKHTAWLSCNNCHPDIFVARKGANEFTMYDVWNGEYCGRCHGKVAFQPKGFENCQRCHSKKKRGGRFR